mmetsp:Transcript_65649/g.154430  ORF Transcript_65649/g.154430 Transcript_65649/m.154430 type:complete len:317 (-) Transcript_65649:2628-3578(-)
MHVVCNFDHHLIKGAMLAPIILHVAQCLELNLAPGRSLMACRFQSTALLWLEDLVEIGGQLRKGLCHSVVRHVGLHCLLHLLSLPACFFYRRWQDHQAVGNDVASTRTHMRNPVEGAGKLVANLGDVDRSNPCLLATQHHSFANATSTNTLRQQFTQLLPMLAILPQSPERIWIGDIAPVRREVAREGVVGTAATQPASIRNVLHHLHVVDASSHAVLQRLLVTMFRQICKGCLRLGTEPLLVTLRLETKANALVILDDLLLFLHGGVQAAASNAEEGRRRHEVRQIHGIMPLGHCEERLASGILRTHHLLLKDTR